MNVQHFNEYLAHCQRIRRAFKSLPIFDTDAVLAAWEDGGIFGFDFVGVCDRQPRSWSNIGAHMSVAAVLGYNLARFAGVSPRNVVEALLIHDWNKRQEITLLRKKGYSVRKIYDTTLHSNEKLLHWFSAPVVRLAGTGGHGGIVLLELRPLSLEEKIVFYADMCTSGSTIVPFKLRIDELQLRMGPGMVYEDTEKYFQRRYGMSHRAKHKEVLCPIEAEFARQVGWSGPQEKLPLHVVPREFHS